MRPRGRAGGRPPRDPRRTGRPGSAGAPGRRPGARRRAASSACPPTSMTACGSMPARSARRSPPWRRRSSTGTCPGSGSNAKGDAPHAPRPGRDARRITTFPSGAASHATRAASDLADPPRVLRTPPSPAAREAPWRGRRTKLSPLSVPIRAEAPPLTGGPPAPVVPSSRSPGAPPHGGGTAEPGGVSPPEAVDPLGLRLEHGYRGHS